MEILLTVIFTLLGVAVGSFLTEMNRNNTGNIVRIT